NLVENFRLDQVFETHFTEAIARRHDPVAISGSPLSQRGDRRANGVSRLEGIANREPYRLATGVLLKQRPIAVAGQTNVRLHALLLSLWLLQIVADAAHIAARIGFKRRPKLLLDLFRAFTLQQALGHL